ncbi:hypothetical protein BH10ACI3_BH10ACI3_13060 [soil metagenome]
MNFRRLGAGGLSDFAENLQTVLAGVELVSLDAGTRSELLAELGTLPAELAEQTAKAMAAEAERKALVSERNATREQISRRVARVRDTLAAKLASSSEFALCGFNHRTGRSRYVAQDPTDLAVAGTSNGVNRLKFAGNNRPGQAVFEIWRREGDTERWGMHATTKKQTFTDPGVAPGLPYEYKVRAVAAKTISNFSNVAVIGEKRGVSHE